MVLVEVSDMPIVGSVKISNKNQKDRRENEKDSKIKNFGTDLFQRNILVGWCISTN